jgi:yecA family protein
LHNINTLSKNVIRILYDMTREPDHGFGLVSVEDQEKLELILTERSDGAYGASALHGMLTASVIGPKPLPLDHILQTVLSASDSEEYAFDAFPDFYWVVEKIEEMFYRIVRVFEEDPEVFRLLVYTPRLKEGDPTPDPRAWCDGFVEAMTYYREDWDKFLATEAGSIELAPILLTSDLGECDDGEGSNPLAEFTPSQMCLGIKMATRAIHTIWSSYKAPPTTIRALGKPGRNDPCPCGSGNKYKRCCGPSV